MADASTAGLEVARSAVPPAERVDDAARYRVIDTLREHTGRGILTLEEFSDRAGLVFAAERQADLDVVVADLPTAEAAAAAPRSRVAARRWIVSVLGSATRKGRWKVGRETNVVTVLGEARIDLRGAELEDGDEIVLRCIVLLGDVRIIVPAGLEVDLGGIAILGDKRCSVTDEGRLRGGPVVKVFGIVALGELSVVSK